MGSHARMLAALCAALMVTMAMASAAGAATSFVRVEGAGSWATSANALVDRVAVEHPAAPLDVTVDGQTFTCAADSPAALLTQVIGRSDWSGTPIETSQGSGNLDTVGLTAVRSVALPLSGTPDWSWVAFSSGSATRDICHSHVPDGYEVLFYPRCNATTPATRQDTCYAGTPLLMRLSGSSSWFEAAPSTVPWGATAPTSFAVADAQAGAPVTNASVTNDEGLTATTRAPSDDPQVAGTAVLGFSGRGDHWARANAPGRVPVRLKLCASDGQDGYCGTPKPDVNTTPPPGPPAQCITNGADGNCGTVDTTGPATHVTNIKQNQVFGRRLGPAKLTGTIDVDHSGLKDVRFRLTRVTTARVIVKPKKKSKKKTTAKKSSVAVAAKKKKKKPKKKVRYRTVKRCTYWSDDTLLFEKAKKCGTKYGKWYGLDVGDIPTTFSYGFEMKLPSGTYVLEIQSHDADGHSELTEPGRNVLAFRVK